MPIERNNQRYTLVSKSRQFFNGGQAFDLSAIIALLNKQANI